MSTLVFFNPLVWLGIGLQGLLLCAIAVIFIKGLRTAKLDKRALLLLVMTILGSGILSYTPPRIASQLNVVPDSVEYAVGANRIIEFGRYDLSVLGVSHPSRYPPGFSLIGIVPFLAVVGGDIGNAILPVFFSALLGTSAAFLIGYLVGGLVCAVTIPLLMISTNFFSGATMVVPHVPCAALTLVALVGYLIVASSKERNIATYGAIGVVIGVAIALRQLSVILATPFFALLFERRDRQLLIPGLVFLSSFIVASTIGELWYNWSFFGAPFDRGIIIGVRFQSIIYRSPYIGGTWGRIS